MIHLIVRAVPGRTEEVLGVVVDPVTMDTLQHDGDAMPVGGYLVAVSEYLQGAAESGDTYACNRDGRYVEAKVFHLQTWEAKQAAVDAAIAGLDPETKAAIGQADHVSEAEKKAKRAAEREAAIAKAAAEKAAKGKP